MYNFVNEAASIRTSSLCYWDNINGYASDFSLEGNVDGWDYWSGIHTFGCASGFLFGTLYGSYALIGRNSVFYPCEAETHYFIRITMKINTVERVSSQVLPTTARIQWVTTADSSFDITKSHDFTIYPDGEWHAYILNMGELQHWQGNINNLRLYPIYEDGRSGDEFFIKGIKISSIDTFSCRNSNCDYYLNYEHPCPGIGTRGYCKSSSNTSSYYTIEEDVNDNFIININDYGNETIKIDPASNATGPEIAKMLTRVISKVGIGGYSEVEIVYTENDEFIIYSGTYTTNSNVVVVDSSAAKTIGFFSSTGSDLSTKQNGTNPASAAESASSFKIKSFQLLTLFDNDENTSFSFDPSMYNVEGGRRDWLTGGFGASNVNIGSNTNTGSSNVTQRDYDIIDNAGKTIIDFNHPFNTSGKIKKIYAACTLDQGYTSVSSNPPATDYEGRDEATGCKVKILRPKRNGNLEVVHSIDIPDRDYSGSRLYSYVQESIDLDCDIWVNKGDLIGIYNANMYTGKSLSGEQVDALYYQVSGEVSSEFSPGDIYGDGLSGLLIYARSDKTQDKLALDIDLGNRVNVEDINIIGSVENTFMEYNLARCLDINWSVDLFGGQHRTGYKYIGTHPDYIGTSLTFTHDNIAYGINKLSNGVYIVKDGYAADGYSVGSSSLSGDHERPTFVPTNPQYFFVNGDQEWLGVYQHKKSSTVSSPFVQDFNEDPIAFTLLFPYGLDKTIFKSAIYFKEKWNFRNFGLSVVYDLNDPTGNADDVRFHYIDEYSEVIIDDLRIEKDGYGYDSVDYYLFTNPCNGEPIFEFSGQRGANGEYLGEVSNYTEYSQASNLDWTYLSHEFEPITCKGFRFYCDYHYSTKITEMELFCRTEELGSNLVGGMSVSYSYYEDLWWQASLEQNSDTEVTAYLGDTPRYFKIEIEPITNTTLNEIVFNIKNDALYVGRKGCEYQVLPVECKINSTNEAQIVEIKNIYDSQYDLYVDIAQDNESEGSLIYHSVMNNAVSITDPEVGPDGVYHKSEDYPLVGQYKNCAINCDCWGLKNLIDGKQSYYSHDNGYSWYEFGTLTSGESIDFSNITVSNFSLINIPVYYRDRYWKIGWLCEDHVAMNVRKMVPFYNDEELTCTFYHDKELPFEDGTMSDTAPHLSNSSVIGSYYKLQGGTNIGFDLGAQKELDKIIWFHDSIADYDTLRCGIDKYTELNLTVKDSNVVDYSYDERSFTMGTGITIDEGKWDFDYNEVTTVSGLFSDSDTSPTSITMPNKPELVDGALWEETAWDNDITLTTNHSIGVDLGTPKEITRIRFYLNIRDGYSGLTWRYGDNNWYVYKSNDNVNWTLCYVMEDGNPTLRVQDNSWEFFSEFFFAVNQTARYFKLWCEEPMYVYTTQSWYNIPTCSEIEVFSEIPNSYKTGISFPGDHSSYISVPASNDLIFPGTRASQYGALAEPFTIDFHVKFNSLPVVSGTDYCTLIRNWPDPVTTVKYGDISFPPENWMSGVVIEDGSAPNFPDASYAIFVRSIYNIARVEGATYSSSAIDSGDIEDVFDGDIESSVRITVLPFYAQCNLPEAKKVIRYGIATYPHSADTNRRIRSWYLQGYITASGTWIDLHSVNDFSAWAAYQVNYWDFTNPYAACTQYRLNVTANWGDIYTYLYELELYDDSEGITPIMYQMEFWTQSSVPPPYAGGRSSIWNRQSYKVVEGGIYHTSMTRGDDYTIQAYVNGERVGGQYGSVDMEIVGMISHSEDVIIGEGLDGIISDFRITKDIERVDQYPHLWHKNERFYTMSIYTSDDNIIYGKYCDIDLYKDNSYSLHSSDDVFSSNYYSYLAIDLGNRYDLELIRSYGDINPYQTGIKLIASPGVDIWSDTCDGVFSDKWIDNSNDNSSANYVNNKLDLFLNYGNEVEGVNVLTQDSFECEACYIFEFDWYPVAASGWYDDDLSDAENSIKIVRTSPSYNINSWNYNRCEQGVGTNSFLQLILRSSKSNLITVRQNVNGSYSTLINKAFTYGTLHRVKWVVDFENYTLDLYMDDVLIANNISWNSSLLDYIGSSFKYNFHWHSYVHTANQVYDNLSITKGITTVGSNISYSSDDISDISNVVFDSDYNDAMWLRIRLLSGDGVSKTIEKLGVYPDISTQLSPAGGHYNHEWDYLGKSITAYESSTNLALGATVSGSDSFGMMYYDYITDGTVNTISSDTLNEESPLYDVWGSNDANPWVYVDLGVVYSIYRFKIYHGSNDNNTDYMITDYSIQTSTDNQTYTTRFTISNNDEFERIHDLINPVQARYVKLNITGYNSKRVLLRVDLEGSILEFFEGAVLREIEVYEYYGYPKIDSEDYPIVAINLGDQFYLSTHSIIGMDINDSTTDWYNKDWNFCYTDSVLDNPSKVDFGEWGEDPYYDRWAVIRMDTATNYNDGPHYLKHVRIISSEDQNPCNYPWWWQSTISTVSRDYNYDIINSVSSLKIEYPASTSVDSISFIEGDNFGVDTLASWRDGFNFRFRVDDIDNLDRSYGYFYLGGHDASSGENPIDYKWYLSTLSGSLTSGWNNLFLRFKQADEIDYISETRTDEDLRIVSTINLSNIGMVYKGIGNELTIHLDGFKIERNRFYDYSATDVGCYLNNNDYITAPIGEYDMSKGTIEFWFRPDYDYDATDYYGTMRNRAIFSFNNNTNDVFGLMVGYTGFEIYFGNTGETLNTFSLGDLGISILDIMFHVGIVFSSDGKHIDSDGSTMRLYFNGSLMFKSTETWGLYDNKHFTFILGGTAPLNLKAGTYIETSSVDAVISDFKIYNYCKKSFYNSMRNIDDKADKLIKPSNFIEISRNNLTYYKVGATTLPLSYENVMPGTSVYVYIRTDLPEGLTGKENRTAGLLCYWDIAV